jgi:pilus assembly protein Flp/PilA
MGDKKMKKLLNGIGSVIKSEDGQGMVEYGLIIGLVAVALIATLLLFAPQIAGVFTRAGAQLDAAGVVAS